MGKVVKNKMGTRRMLPLIISMSLPAMFSMFVQALYNVVDSIFVAQISEQALTAVSLAFPVQVFLIAIAAGTGIGANSLIARKLGEGEQREADSAATHSLILAALSWTFFALFGLFFTRPFFEAFTTDPSIIEMGVQYTSCISIFSFGVLIECSVEKVLQATGNMIYPMVFLLIGAITNVVLDPLFIFGLLGFPKLGVLGAAVATVIGQIIAMAYSLYVLLTKDHDIKISFYKFRFHLKTVKNIYAVGFPAIIMQAMGSVMLIALNAILILFSGTAVSVLGIYFKLQSFVFMPVFGLTQGVMPIMGYNFGAGNKKRLLDALKIGSVIAIIIMALGTLLFWMLPDSLLMIFNASDEMLSVGRVALRVISLSFIPAAIGIMLSTLFQAINKGRKSLLVSLLRQLIVIVPVSYLLAKIGLNYVWYSFPIAEVVSLTASVVVFYIIYHKLIKKLRPVSIETE